ncbi:helix-turn-helix transcriptional regulator [uncultured Roseobacter sp.]|uniref:helix-turn-helix transcriptional regulator n=1 Tax=uncultured Roseobacter sp. TaxID=114847 RepID=UPI002604C804|nr:helix-turn-helix transcriptional regulator [uncultured Roseobacter sp.]
MSTEFALDLRAARRKAGYTQGDIAHLLDHHQSHVSDLEQGLERPTLVEIITLSLIYGRSFESFFDRIMTECQDHLTTRLGSLPPPSAKTAGTFNRKSSLAKLKRRLQVSDTSHGSA